MAPAVPSGYRLFLAEQNILQIIEFPRAPTPFDYTGFPIPAPFSKGGLSGPNSEWMRLLPRLGLLFFPPEVWCFLPTRKRQKGPRFFRTVTSGCVRSDADHAVL